LFLFVIISNFVQIWTWYINFKKCIYFSIRFHRSYMKYLWQACIKLSSINYKKVGNVYHSTIVLEWVTVMILKSLYTKINSGRRWWSVSLLSIFYDIIAIKVSNIVSWNKFSENIAFENFTVCIKYNNILVYFKSF